MGDCFCQLFQALLCLSVIIGVIWYATGQPDMEEIVEGFKGLDFGNMTDVLDSFTDIGGIWDEDPYVGNNETSSWDNGKNQEGGLELTLLNALDTNWHRHFLMAVQDWDAGDPDALTLSPVEVEVDYSCTPVEGVMKVCNGNYGDTGWLGINEIMSTTSRDAFIVNSVAKMNEFYLMNAELEERQYTMCHEIGHGFGLPHTDENFDNADLGNCMDYTSNPGNNLHPDDTNYQRLASLYGVVGQERQRRRLNAGDPPSSSVTSNHESFEFFSLNLLHLYEQAMSDFDLAQIPNLADNFLENTVDTSVRFGDRDDHYKGWRMLEHRQGGARFVRHLNENFKLEVHALFSF